MSYYSTTNEWEGAFYILAFVICLVIWFAMAVGTNNQEASWLEVAPPGSHIEYYQDSPYNNEWSHGKPKVIFPDGKIWYPDRDACPVTK